MQFISLSEGQNNNLDKNKKLAQLSSINASLFTQLNLICISNVCSSQNTRLLLFIGSVLLPKSKNWLNIKWKIVIKIQYIKFQIGLSPAQSGLTSNLCSQFKVKSQQIIQFVHQINNLRLKRENSFFYFLQSDGDFLYRAKVLGTNYISNNNRMALFLKSKINQFSRNYLKELETIIFYYKIAGFSNLQYECLVVNNHKAIALRYNSKKVAMLRQVFQRNRIKRRNKVQQEQNDMKLYKQISQSFSFLLTQKYFNFDQQFLLHQRQVFEAFSEYKRDIQRINSYLEKQQQSNSQSILTTIEVYSIQKEKHVRSGGYCEIMSAIYTFTPLLSIDKVINDEFKNSIKSEKIRQKLAKKSSKSNQLDPSLQNQFIFLHFMRNKICSQIAKYYCNNNVFPFSDGQLFMELYPYSLGQTILKQWQKIKIIEDLTIALLFLSKEGIIHRDIKEQNIMIDRNKRAKLIDFGSVTNIWGVNRFQPSDNKLRLTEGYYLPYSQVVQMVPNFEREMSKSQYYHHKSFDHYALGKVIQRQFYLDYLAGQKDFFRHNLKYLSDKCVEPHLEDRLTIQELNVFIRQLLHFYQLQRQFWELGFDPNFKSFKFNETYEEQVQKWKNQTNSKEQSIPS